MARHPHVVKWGEGRVQSKSSFDSWGEALDAAKDAAQSFEKTAYIYTVSFGGLKLKASVTPDGEVHYGGVTM